jgi:NAD-dependent deacetylase
MERAALPAESDMPKILEQAIGLLRASSYTVALTGAGVSTPSGIPDFRGNHSGLWRHHDPLSVASIWAFHDDPGQFYSWIRPVIHRAKVAQPNPAHRALAELEQANCLKTVITQNIDSLHQRAGSHRVLEMHGHTRTATCLGCRGSYAAESLWSAVLDGNQPAPCPTCGGILKPDVILFGEPLPYDTVSAAQHEALAADVMLIAGTSLEVMPAADLPLLAQRRGARLILVNLTPTPLDDRMDAVIRADVVKTLQQFRRALIGR